MAHGPYCGNCGYSLIGLTESSKCPECGQPIVDVLMRPAFGAAMGRRYTSPIIIFGLPLVHIAVGPGEDGPIGKARGIIAIGERATGWLAIGGVARGFIAIGGMAIGLVAFGGAAIGGICLGGGACGVVAMGGGAVGVIATGGGAIGGVAMGGGAIGYYARSPGAVGTHVISVRQRDPEAVQFFQQNAWLLGGTGQTGLSANLAAWTIVAILAIALTLFLLVFLRFLAVVRGQT